MDRRSLLKGVALAGGAASALAAGRAAAAPAKTLSGQAAPYAPALAKLAAYAELHRKTLNLPGVTLSVADAAGFSALITVGFADVERGLPVTGDHVFQIGSISKSLVALCLFRLMEADRLDPDARMVALLPGVALAPDSPVTVQHLLSHSGGLPDDAPIFPRTADGLLWSDFTPGARWSYSNTGYTLLGHLLEHIHQRPLREIIDHEVLTPLGMPGALGAILDDDRDRYALGYRPWRSDRPYPLAGRLGPAPWVDVAEGNGCVAATGPQMARYLAWLIAAAKGRGAPLLSDAGAARYLAPVVDAPDWAPGALYANGLAIVKVDGRTLIHHTGGMVSFSSSLHVDPAAGVGAFASTNVGMTNYRPRDITTYACALMRWSRDGGPEPKAPDLPDPTIEKPQEYVGLFTAPDGRTLDIRAAGAGLSVVHGGLAQPLQFRGPGRFLAPQGRLGRYHLIAERQDGRVRSIWNGPVEYAADPAQPRRPVNPALQALAGRYDNESPWNGVARIVAKHDGLSVDGETPLKQLPDGSWRVAADPTPPERLVFDAPLGGRPSRMTFSGVDFIRRSE